MYFQKISVPDNFCLKSRRTLKKQNTSVKKIYEKHWEKCTQKRNPKNF